MEAGVGIKRVGKVFVGLAALMQPNLRTSNMSNNKYQERLVVFEDSCCNYADILRLFTIIMMSCRVPLAT